MDNYELLLEELLRQETDYQFNIFTNQTAIAIGSAILARANQMGKCISVDIRRNGDVLFHAKQEGMGPNNDRWIQRKINVVHHFGHSSYYMHVLYKSWNTTIQENAYVNPMEYATEGGSFPILIRDVGVIGTISVSGLAGDEDHGIIVSVLKEYMS
ncbi:MAG: heme-degrading domain-containing protein [Candidatus Cohnella colombiensis]|uniref:Heme-degrading domain-containing protein n=1 Tax=Candidatus Cohnella colombiensis TaxID=3121368 RepID=A0AA95J9P8_9BACL|nr:MAG: heme-degrading domain-containing protein [Cohnella sp.]